MSRALTEQQPDLRFLQANERTLLAWIRTGLTMMAFGFVVARLAVWLQLEHPGRDQGSLSSWLGVGIVALGVACHVVGAIRFLHTRRALTAGVAVNPGPKGPVAIATLIAVLGVGAIVYILLTAQSA